MDLIKFTKMGFFGTMHSMNHFLSSSTEHQDDILLKDQSSIRFPRMYQVIMLNDDYTTMDFVILILQDVFFKTAPESQEIMIEVHTKGKSVVGVYTYDVAQTKILQVKELSKKEWFPLSCVLEEEKNNGN